MLFGRKDKLQIDLGELTAEKTQLTTFLENLLKAPITPIENKLAIETQKTTPQDLQHAVTKFIYHHNLNNKYYTTINGNTIKINTFKGTTKKPTKKKDTLHQNSRPKLGEL